MTRCSSKKLRISAGFTLIELMIVVSIIGILAAIAIPSYTSSVARGHRASARAQLLQAGQYMQRFYAANDRYDVDRVGTSIWEIVPPSLLLAPADGTQLYEISNTGTNNSRADNSTFNLVMRPLAGAVMENDQCGGFTLTQSGAKGITINGATTTQISECWR